MKRKGFTLIELLVVIAIIAILAAILFPVFANAKERARQSKCLGNLKQLTTAFRSYADDNGGRLPSAFVGWSRPDWCGAVATEGFDVYPEQGSVWRYSGKSRAIYLCPTDIKVAPDFIRSNKNYSISYTMNSSLHLLYAEATRRPTRVLLLIHEGRKTIDDGCFYWKSDSTKNLPSKIHYSGTTASYLDGHAKWLSYDMLRQERADLLWDPTHE